MAAAKRGRSRRQRKKGLKADYRGATPEQVAAAVLRYRTQPGMRDAKRFVNPSPQ